VADLWADARLLDLARSEWREQVDRRGGDGCAP
jgi:hypothetical protein